MSASAVPPPAEGAIEGSALLVVRGGPGQRQAAGVLAVLGLATRTAAEPYAALASFLPDPTDLVVISLRGWRRPDLAFLSTLRQQERPPRVVLLVPPNRRALAARALERGADAVIVEPYYPEELAGQVRALLRPPAAEVAAGPSENVAVLAGEVAHAINNPLQVLSLVAEGEDLPPASREQLQRQIARVRHVTDWLGAFGRLGPARRAPVDLPRLVREELEQARLAGWVAPLVGSGASSGTALVDSDLVRWAVRSACACVGGRAPTPPLRIEGAAHVNGDSAGISLIVPGLAPEHLQAPAVWEGILLTRDDTRAPYPGLALARAVAASHGGALTVNAVDQGLMLSMTL